jgi:spore germination cell wall hydrolase CwlJ-like protein
MGQMAVAQVVMRRAENNPKNVCKEVSKPFQFSWTNSLPKTGYRAWGAYKEPDSWVTAVKVAATVMSVRGLPDFSKGAHSYHAVYVKPAWARAYTVSARIGNHIFYA